MNQPLSQSDVDALLTAVADGSVPAGGAGAAGGAGGGDAAGAAGAGEADLPQISPYDLTYQDRVVRGRMPTLDIIYERFIRLFRISLSNSLRKIASISIISTDLLKFGEFVNTLPIPSCMCLMRFESLRGPALLVFESKLAYALVDSYFGGTDRPFAKIEGKEFTRIELLIMNKVMDLAMRDLEEAWEPIHKTEIKFMRMETNPQFVGIVPPSEVIVSTTFEVELESANGTIALIIPYSTIEPIKQKLNSAFQVDASRPDDMWAKRIHQHMTEVEAEVKVQLGQASITMSDLVNLNVGDVIPLNRDSDGELDLIVEGVPKFKCYFGTSRGNRAVQITRTVEDHLAGRT